MNENDLCWLEAEQEVNRKTTTDIWAKEKHNEFIDNENKLILQNAPS